MPDALLTNSVKLISSKNTVANDYFKCVLPCFGGTRWHSRLRHCATSRKIAGSINDSVTRIFHRQNPSGRTMSLGSTQPLTEMSTMAGKGGRCVGLTLPPSYADCHEIWEPQPPGTLRACPGLEWDCFSFTFTSHVLHVQYNWHNTNYKQGNLVSWGRAQSLGRSR